MILWTKCKVNPELEGFEIHFKTLHPDFHEPLFLGEVDETMLYRYIVATYDVESPYVIKYSDWAQRRRQTAAYAGFPKKSGRYIPEAEQIILGKNKRVNNVVLRYLFLQNDIDFMLYQSYQFMYYNQLGKTQTADYDNPGHYDKLKSNIEDLSKNIKNLQTSIFHGDESKEMLKSLYDFVGRISLDIRPEDRADKIEKGEDIVDDNPYGEYKPDKMTFADDH